MSARATGALAAPTALVALITLISIIATGPIACAPAAPAPAPVPAVPVPQPVPTHPAPGQTASATTGSIRGGPWSFSYTPGSYSYTMVTEGTVAPLSDTTQKRAVPAVPALPERATVVVGPSGTVQVVQPTVDSNGACDIASATVTRAQQLIPALPAHMTAGESWTDSTTTDGCRGSVPATSHVTRTYTVLSDTTFAGITALHVHRIDVINASGEGAEGQHRVLLSASGNGSAELFFDVSTGRFLGSEGVQNSVVDVNTSGRITRFLQRVAEHVRLASTP